MNSLNKKLLSFLALSLFVFSCNKKTEADIQLNEQDTTKADSVIFRSEDERAEKQKILGAFSTFPPEINGCSCYYSLTEDDFKSNKYVFASNFGKDGFATISGVMTNFQLVKTDSISPTHSIKTYRGDHYDVTIETEKTGELEETWQQKGKLTLTEDNKEIFYIDITGECGC